MPDQLPVQESFAGIAGLYERYRAGYPVAVAVTALDGLPPPVHVADVGCGTGLAGRVFAGQGAAVVGVEPNPDMIEQARAAAAAAGADIEYRPGTGEETGLAGGAIDLVVCAQSFQWFDAERALREFHRILRPGGRLALIWNDKSDTDEFSVSFSRILKQAQAEAKRAGQWHPRNRSRDPGVSGHFEDVRVQRFPNPQPMDLDGVLGRARSASFFPKTGSLRETLERQLCALFAQHEHDGIVTLQHDAELTLANRSA